MTDETLVRSLLSEQCPDLADRELRRVDGGWDNRMWRLGDDLAVRLPRTSRAPSLLENEHRWLPVLAPRLPLAVPVPVRSGEPSERFPKPWIVTTWVAGEPADRVPIDRGPDAAEALARFLTALHVEAPGDAPVNSRRGGPLKRYADEIERQSETLAPEGAADRMREVWDDAVAAAEWDRPAVWVHGDLHPANAVVADGTLAGVIDFGEMRAGDPAADLAAAWLLLPEGAAARFFEAYAEADEVTIRRARGWALLGCLQMLEIGRAGQLGLPGGKPTWRRTGEAALNRLLGSSASSP
ncbi:aminoglycoside phosphotransferase family protein [Glycomyces xiaoerkulensis]|uniref:aminoglycoside phosphotransferase family protein n=1 Tax=Glycomyces xiaoerkulensis TaxID=2038139 RepID=UPI0018E46A75|nr:aminoglycoside phosphotransferase family protein [Glycomyces xiaoerkulensis]